MMHTLHQYADALRLSRNPRTVRALLRHTPGRQTLSVRFGGRSIRIVVRADSSDVDLVRSVLCRDSEYRHSLPAAPSVIFDVGANIGVTALYFATLYPDAKIYCFEPLPENVALLGQNTAPFSGRITVVPRALGDREGFLDYCYSDDPTNFGGGTFYGVGCDRSRVIRLPMTTIGRACAELGVEQIDLLKIDTEGAEMAVLSGTPDHIMRRVPAVIGELHGVDDFAFLSRLASTHKVGFTKQPAERCFHFAASLA